MNPFHYFVAAALLVALWLCFIVFPWIKRKTLHDKAVSNIQIIKQRLLELSREKQEGLIATDDLEQMERELKQALLEESRPKAEQSSNVTTAISLGLGVALLVGGTSYYFSHQVTEMSQIFQALEQLPALSAKLQTSDANDISAEDVQYLSLAIRQRLKDNPEDVQGWLYLTRLQLALGQEVQAVAAVEKAWRLSPGSENVRTAYIQTLMATADETQLRKAEVVLKRLLSETPDNDNYLLMMAVVSAQLGRAQQADHYFAQVKDKLNPASPIYQSLQQRINELTGIQQPDTGFVVNVQLADGLAEALPSDGFLIVFAQDADSANRMPAAVVKLPLGELPARVVLGSEQAMVETYKLASLQNVTVVARISADENVASTAGELQGERVVEVTQGTMVPVTVVISRILSE